MKLTHYRYPAGRKSHPHTLREWNTSNRPRKRCQQRTGFGSLAGSGVCSAYDPHKGGRAGEAQRQAHQGLVRRE